MNRKGRARGRQVRKESSSLTDAMEAYEDEMTRENYIATNFLGEVGPDDEIPADVEEAFPEQFRRATLLKTPSASDRVQ